MHFIITNRVLLLTIFCVFWLPNFCSGTPEAHGIDEAVESSSSSSQSLWRPNCKCERATLCILFLQPSNQLLRSHANFAASLVRVLRQKYTVCFIVPINREADKLGAEISTELDVQYMKFGVEKSAGEEAELEQMDLDTKCTAVSTPFYTQLWSDIIKNRALMDALDAQKFNVGIAEMLHPSRYAFAVFHALNLPHTINIKSYTPDALHLLDLGLRSDILRNLTPHVYGTKFGYHLDSVRRQHAKEIRQSFDQSSNSSAKKMEDMDKEFVHLSTDLFPGFRMNMNSGSKDGSSKFPGLREMFAKTRFYLVNGQPELEFDGGEALGKVAAKVKMVGGIHQKQAHDLAPIEQNGAILSKIEGMQANISGRNRKSKNGANIAGIVLISFGTVLDTRSQLDETRFAVMVNMVRAFPRLLFIWQLTKGDDTRIARLNALPNVHADSWVDVQAILADVRTKSFVSHCGRNSQLEAAYHGVPLVCVPIAFDQIYNAESTARRKAGVVLDFNCVEEQGNGIHIQQKRCFTESALKRAVHETVYRFHWVVDGKRLIAESNMLKGRKRPAAVLLEAMQEIEKENL